MKSSTFIEGAITSFTPKINKIFWTFCCSFICFSFLSANDIQIRENLKWEEQTNRAFIGPEDYVDRLYFEGAYFHADYPSLPVYSTRFPVTSYGNIEVRIINENYEPLVGFNPVDKNYLESTLKIKARVTAERRKHFGQISFVPIRINTNGELEKLVSFELEVSFRPTSAAFSRGSSTQSSKLEDGNIYKIQIEKSGIHKLDYNFLKNDLGISDLDNIDPAKIQLLGNGGGMLPEMLTEERIDDLYENAIEVVGQGDGSFDSGDYILFYAEGADVVKYHPSKDVLYTERNLYTNKNHYFIKIGNSNGKRIANQSSVSANEYTSKVYDAVKSYELDRVNLLEIADRTHGSGKDWYGESFKINQEQSFDFSFSNVNTSEPAKAYIRYAAHSETVGSTFKTQIGNQNFQTFLSQGYIGLNQEYAKLDEVLDNFTPPGNNITVNIEYEKTNSAAEGWLDAIHLNVRCNLNYSGNEMTFRDLETLNFSASTFELGNTTGSVRVWDISNPIEVKEQQTTTSGNKQIFGAETGELKTFIAFDGGSYHTPEAIGKVDNQNLHGINQADMIIIYNRTFEVAAQKLAQHRSNYSNLKVEAVPVDLIYNEFGSGNIDISAIRDFVKMVYDRDPDFRYLAIIGDCSYDYKHIYEDLPNTNKVPIFQSLNSVKGTGSYATDDFYALLDDNEGNPDISDLLDISVGRIPANTAEEANGAIDKIIRYDTDPQVLGEWKNLVLYNADDEDTNIHIRDADTIAERVRKGYKTMNVLKNYFDSYVQQTTSGGARFPQAEEFINKSMFKGVFAVNYMGHGGSSGWAQERVLKMSDIASWNNKYKLPIFVTATCSFAPLDAPEIGVSGGETIMLKPDGGGIALYTTTRAVFTNGNKALTSNVFKYLFEKTPQGYRTLGEIYTQAKNDTDDSNSRRFTLLGDPAQYLAYPKYNVVTTKINGQPVSNTDTLGALELVTIEGEIRDDNGGLLDDFTGKVYPTVYDKLAKIPTLVNDEGSRLHKFNIRKNIIFRGAASVSNGKFQFSFVIPKDINYNYGLGKISYYADNGVDMDAAGYFDGIVIGGNGENAVVDDQGPEVEVYMNTEQFVFGGVTNESPVLLVVLEDDYGINTVGNGIGHDLTATLDENAQNIYVLNDFYESETDNYRKGKILYPLYNLSEGRHGIRVKAWDVANNSAEGYTEFVVAASAEVALKHVLNYPNPFTTNTSFQFEHNYPGQPLSVQIQVFTVGGQLVKTIQEEVQPEGLLVTNIQWDGTDDFGSRIGRGVYLYKLRVGAVNPNGEMVSTESEFEKLVILK